MDRNSSATPSSHHSIDGPGARNILTNDTDPGSSRPLPSIPSPTMDSPQPNPHPAGSAPPSQRDRSTASPSGSDKQNSSSAGKRVGGKANVSAACGPCKRAHLACDIARPCKRCVNMGKEDQCEDVPHKKRGRPKVPKPALGEPYHRVRPAAAEENGIGKWRGPSAYDAPYMPTTGPSPPALPLLPRPISPSRAAPDADPNYVAPSLFTLFCTTEMKILRATPACYQLTGYHPHEFVNLNLLDWLHPADRHLIDMERNRLTSVPYVTGQLTSHRDTHAAITQRSERELLSPAEGMREPYPNQNVRVLRSDNGFSLYNVRLHLGGGLGASLWRPETLGRIYLVVSCLLVASQGGGRRDQLLVPRAAAPPSPITPVPLAQPPQPRALPSFSSIAAAADIPGGGGGGGSGQPQSYDRSSNPNASLNGGPYYPQARPPPPQPYLLSRTMSGSSSTNLSSAHRQTPSPPSSYPPTDPQAYRRGSDGSGGGGTGGGGHGNGLGNGHLNARTISSGGPTPTSAQADYSRRAWEL
ncbi:hypothetical protein P7C73_g4733, partial [Tremellales sp. Uapishka_1]